jgi:dihydrolipoamide dehydrogenase
MERSDLVIIGGGPGGYAAAFRAADLGLSVTLVEERQKLGGVCLLEGCIPSKTLLHVARLITEAREAADWGVFFEEPRVDLDALRAWKSQVIDKLSAGVDQLCRRRKVRTVRARASFIDSTMLGLEGDGDVPPRLGFDRAIIATGSEVVVPENLRLDDPRVWGSAEALELRQVPPRLLVIGGGYIGLELATVYAGLGSKVTVAELEGEILKGVDRDLVKPLVQRLERSLHALYLSTGAHAIEPRETGLMVALEGQGVPGEQMFDAALVAVGRRPRSHGLGLGQTKVELDPRGFIRVNRRQETADRHILAIGDVAGQPMLTHKASREGKIAAEVVAGEPSEFDNVAIPAVVFTDPEIAWCGISETGAKEQGIPIKVARFPWGASGRAHTLGRTDGLTKLIYDPESERVIGGGIAGVGAGELIAEAVLAVEMGAVARDVANTIHTHPTLAETVGETAEGILGGATHLYSPRPKGRMDS